MIQYDCPLCRRPFTVKASLAGQVIMCPSCNGHVQLPSRAVTHPPVQQSAPPPSPLVTITNDGRVLANFNTVPQARQVLKELRLQKKQLNLLKRQANQEQKAIRARYTDHVRQRGSKFRGGGKIGGFIRAVQTSSRDATRAQLAHDLAPLEEQKQRIDVVKNAIDHVMLQVEEYILRNSNP